jgi:hypothetical protein
MEGMVIIDGRDGAGLRQCHWCGQGSFLAVSRARVAVRRHDAAVSRSSQPSCSRRASTRSRTHGHRSTLAVDDELVHPSYRALRRCSLIDLSEVGRFTQ